MCDMTRGILVAMLWVYGVSCWSVCGVAADSSEAAGKVHWLTDYHAGMDAAEARRQMALIWFYDPVQPSENERFERELVGANGVAKLVAERFAAIRLPVSAVVQSGGKEVALLEQPAFGEMQQAAGLAIVDMTEPEGPLHRQVVSVLPFSKGAISAEKLAVLLTLPRGSLTQRTLIYAVRTHPEFPASTKGHLSQVLSRETEKHSTHQAHITLQGHHQWESRFHAINAELPGNLLAKEVCAESWPGQPLLEAAMECVHSWRQSSGHWDAVRSEHAMFGYDMKRGANGVWYATGIFAGRN
jgi:hypothetical protein